MANEKVSQMTSLTAGELADEDLFLVADMSARESKKMSTADFLTYIQGTGSFHTYQSDSASYVPGSGVDGIVDSASYAINSNSSSYSVTSTTSNNSNTASLALTASYVSITGLSVDTASYLLYNGNFNGTSSYALTASNVNYTKTSSFLLYTPGISNGTASYSFSSSVSISSSYGYLSFQSVSSSYSDTSSFVISSSYSENSLSSSYITESFIYSHTPIKAWAWVTWSLGVNYPRLYKSYNINSITYLGVSTFPPLTVYSLPETRSSFGVEFTNPLSNANYMLMGDGYQPYGSAERAGVYIHPSYGNVTTNSFTMSVITATTNDWYVSSGLDEVGNITFQILGL